EKGKIVEESRRTPSPTPIRSLRIHTTLVESFHTLDDHLQEVMAESLPVMVDEHVKEQVKQQVPEQAEISLQIQNAIANNIPSQVDVSVRRYQLYLSMKDDPQLQTPAVRPRDQDDPHNDARPKGVKSAKRQKTSEYEAYVTGESSSRQVTE
ncbi:hypothetical protein Tco_0141758, partial [Tanacetum coccineum]